MPSSSIRIGGSSFIDFVVAPASTKIAVVRDAISLYGARYQPSHDFYREWRHALLDGLESGATGLNLRRAAALQTVPARARHYRDLTLGWEGLPQRWEIRASGYDRQNWVYDTLEVGIRPELLVQVKGELVLTKLYLKEPPLTKDGARAAIHMMRTLHPDVPHFGVLDVRRRALMRPRMLKDSDAWLAGQASGLITMWERMTQVA